MAEQDGRCCRDLSLGAGFGKQVVARAEREGAGAKTNLHLLLGVGREALRRRELLEALVDVRCNLGYGCIPSNN